MERFAVRSKVMTLRPDGGRGAAARWRAVPRAPGRPPGCVSRRGRKMGALLAAPALPRLSRSRHPGQPRAGPPPAGNRYVKYFRNIRAIQDYLAKSGEGACAGRVGCSGGGCMRWAGGAGGTSGPVQGAPLGSSPSDDRGPRARGPSKVWCVGWRPERGSAAGAPPAVALRCAAPDRCPGPRRPRSRQALHPQG